MNVADLTDKLIDNATYSVRRYRQRDAENPPPFKPEVLFVQRHNSHVVLVTTLTTSWAELDPRQDFWIEGNILRGCAEDYNLDIEISSIFG